MYWKLSGGFYYDYIKGSVLILKNYMNEVSKEEFFNFINLLLSPDSEIRELGLLVGLTFGILINKNKNFFSFQYKNSFWFIGHGTFNCWITNKFLYINLSDELWQNIK